MQYILTQSGKKMPFYNVRKITDNNNQPVALVITFRVEELQEAGITEESIKTVIKKTDEVTEMTAYNDSDILMNTYYKYNKLDEISYKYDYCISPYIPAVEAQAEQLDAQGNVIVPAVEGKEAVPEVRDTLIIVTLQKQSEFEAEVEETSKTVDAIAVAMAELMGV